MIATMRRCHSFGVSQVWTAGHLFLLTPRKQKTCTLRTLLLLVDQDHTVKIGVPPNDRMDNFFARSTILGRLQNVSHVACSPEGELFCVRSGDLYRGAMPSNKDVDYFSVAKRVGKSEWSRTKLMFFHPNGDLYATTREGAFYKGSPPDNEHIPWIYETATKIGGRFWDRYEVMFFDPDGILYAVSNAEKMFKAPPPTQEHCLWIDESTEIGIWRSLPHFMAISPDRKLWGVDKYNGNIYRGEIPKPGQGDYLIKADYLGWNYHLGRFLAFTKDKTIHNIISFEFLPDEGKRISEIPEVIEEKIYDNRRSSCTLKHTFTFQKTIRTSSSFSHEHGFTFEVGTEIGFKTGVPSIAEGSTKVTMNMSTTHNWNFTKTNETEKAKILPPYLTYDCTFSLLPRGTLLLSVARDYTVKIGLPPRDRLDSFNSRATICGKLQNVSHVACSPEGELFCIRGGDLYRGPMPSNKDVDWFSVAQRVGKYEWNRMQCIFFHPNGDLYGITHEGDFYKGPPPENEHITWLYEKAKKIGARDWQQFEAIFFDPQGILYAVRNNDEFYKRAPPTDESVQWLPSSTEIGSGGWRRLTHFMSFTPDGKLWSIDKYNGNIYRGDPPTPENTSYVKNADYLGWSYNEFRFFAFTKDKTIHNIISFEFLPDEGKRVSENPEVIEEKIYDNRRSSSTLRHTFTFQKTIKESSSFSHEHGFTFAAGVEIGFKTGIPVIAEGTVNVSINMSTTHNWSFTETNETQVSFSTSTEIELEPGKAIRMVASVVKAELNVPYKARARTLFGSEVEIKGMWNGVSHYNLMVTQEDYNK